MMPKSVVLDTNLLVLFVVGLVDPKYIAIHKRLRTYDADDFDLLRRIVSISGGLIVTPNTLSEASNLLKQINEPARTMIGRGFRQMIERVQEVYVESAIASARPEFLRLGLTDSAILHVGKDDVVLLSADFDLCIAAQSAGYEAQNFNHLRDGSYG